MNKKCQVFTPIKTVRKMIDQLEYKNNLYGKKIIENACGDGNIICEIVRVYIKVCISEGLHKDQIKYGLENDIYGAEIDKIHYKNCIKNLDAIAKEFNIFNVSWKIFNEDILKKKINIKFDYVIGNPPYISYNDLDKETREFVRNNYFSCNSGKFDYCYPFIEHGLNLLNDNGKMVYLIPNSIFKNVYADKLRGLILPYLRKITDYTEIKIFNNVLISSSIILLKKEEKIDFIQYYDVLKDTNIKINKNSLEFKWIFRKEYRSDRTKVRLGDYFHCSMSIATLLNEAFLIKESNIICEIESQVIKTAVSPKSLFRKKTEKIIFPYYFNSEKNLSKISENEFIEKYPNAYNYLSLFRDKLELRRSDKSAKWFEYGRSQGLNHLYKEKLLVSPILTNKLKVYELNKETIPYSGIVITKKSEYPLSFARKILLSTSFNEYLKSVGVNMNGGSIRFSPKDINNFQFDEKLLEK